ncbi:MAG: hypothetical protein U9N63_15045, partial [Pseudomonadota bacterium]|nr:hypothetical protein [Pseudomonadota bacterium]
RILGARQKDILKLSHHHAEALFSLASDGTVQGDSIFGVDKTLLTPEEQATQYEQQVVNGPWMDKTNCYIPSELKPLLTAIGFVVGGKEDVYLSGRGFAQAYTLRYELHAPHGVDPHSGTRPALPASIIRLPFTGATPEIWTMGEDDTFFRLATDAVIVGHQSAYVLVKIYEPGEYVAVEPGAGGGNALLYDLWGAYFK